MTTPTQHRSAGSIDPASSVGLLALTVTNLARSLTFYTKALGFEILEQEARTATLGAAGRPLLLITELLGAQSWRAGGRGHTGLFHFAVLLPTRADLGRWVRHWLSLGLPPPGQGDHLVSEALYLEDPDGHGIEIYRDRPRDQWQWSNGQVTMATLPVDMEGLLTEAEQSGTPWTGLPAGTRLGHMHLQIGDVQQAADFYHALLGFDTVARMPSALFISAGGYHHHLGLNTWNSRGGGPAPAGTAKLQFFTIVLPTEEARREVLARLEAAGSSYKQVADVVVLQDPWQQAIVLLVGDTLDARAAAALSEAFAQATVIPAGSGSRP